MAIATATNDAAGKNEFAPVVTQIKLVKLLQPLNTRRVKKGTYKYTVTEVKGTDATVNYDTMAADCNSHCFS